MKNEDINVPVIEDREKLLEEKKMPGYKRVLALVGIAIFVVGIAGAIGSCFITRALYYPHCCYNEATKCADGCFYPEYPFYPFCCYGEDEKCYDGCNYAARYVPNTVFNTFQLIGLVGIGIGALTFLAFYISGSMPLVRAKKQEHERLRMEYERKMAEETGEGAKTSGEETEADAKGDEQEIFYIDEESINKVE